MQVQVLSPAPKQKDTLAVSFCFRLGDVLLYLPAIGGSSAGSACASKSSWGSSSPVARTNQNPHHDADFFLIKGTRRKSRLPFSLQSLILVHTLGFTYFSAVGAFFNSLIKTTVTLLRTVVFCF
ncbi:MAG: hypothetical protein IJC46_03500 [Clostridia bacterium]|nr:hypothetical protein [Clostridia bacterium]